MQFYRKLLRTATYISIGFFKPNRKLQYTILGKDRSDRRSVTGCQAIKDMYVSILSCNKVCAMYLLCTCVTLGGAQLLVIYATLLKQ